MKTRRHVALAAFAALIGASLLSADKGGSNGQINETRLRTLLAGSALQGKTPEGHADFRSDARGRIRLNVEVEYVNLPAGTVLTVSVQEEQVVTSVGTIKLSAFGGGELELNSEDGEAVPAVKKGDMVTVGNGGKRILAGVF